eukprot:c12208_g1_i1 orf=422-1846(+)
MEVGSEAVQQVLMSDNHRLEGVDLIVEDSEEEVFVKDSEEDCSSDEVSIPSGFLYSRALLPERFLSRRRSFLSTGFRSATAVAGWDDEALQLATAAEQADQERNDNLSTRQEEVNLKIPHIQDGAPSLSFRVEGSPEVHPNRRQIRDRKREERTPRQAVTPLSAGRRHRRPRRQSIREQSLQTLPIEDLSLNKEFQGEITSQDDIQLRTLPEVLSTEIPTETGREDSSLIIASADEKPSSSSETRSFEGDDEREFGKRVEGEEHQNEKPGCLDQLRDELSCAVCLDICVEPSTTSCGHSFCKDCLQSVVQKCSPPRCPKCRQPLKGDLQRTCPVNIVLWNTIQILFPKESSIAKAAARKQDRSKESPAPKKSGSRISTAVIQSSIPSSSLFGGIAGINSTRPAGNFRRAFRPPAVLQRREVTFFSDDEETSNYAADRDRIEQEQIDAALARRLQVAELMRGSGTAEGVREQVQN